MPEQSDPFLPHHVDESIEQLTSTNHADNALRGQAYRDPDAHLVLGLQKLYGPERERYQGALQRVENRLVEQYSAREEGPVVFPIPLLERRQLSYRRKTQQGRLHRMEYKSSSASGLAKFGRLAGSLAAVLVIVGSLVIVLNYAHSRTTTAAPRTATATATKVVKTPDTAPGDPVGTTLYTTPSNMFGFSGLAWSPDSKRVASATANGVQIWDATSGNHLVTVQMPGANEWPWGLDWSHDSQLVAIGTNQHVLIVNGQSGQIVLTYAGNTTAMKTTTSSGPSYLNSLFPASGGFGFRATAWSPDGHLMASSLSFGPNGEVQVWNPQSGAFEFNLKVAGPYVVSSLAWSSDGRYIAANAYNTQGGDPNQPDDTIVVWQVSTHAIIFQHSDYMNSDAPIAWQPQSHNLAFEGNVFSGGNQLAAIKIWDVTAGKQLKQYIGAGTTNGLAWSPDGKYLAYSGYGAKDASIVVVILDEATGKQVYVYTGHKNSVSVIAWSPDGKYIASGEGNTRGNLVAKVWVAV